MTQTIILQYMLPLMIKHAREIKKYNTDAMNTTHEKGHALGAYRIGLQ